jgi:hypothetical protein
LSRNKSDLTIEGLLHKPRFGKRFGKRRGKRRLRAFASGTFGGSTAVFHPLEIGFLLDSTRLYELLGSDVCHLLPAKHPFFLQPSRHLDQLIPASVNFRNFSVYAFILPFQIFSQ